jgi:uncharacterized CHY-type Zn-finger protein
MEASPNDRLHFGKMGFGCKHYKRRCQIRAPCCNEVFDCRHCHNESTSTLRNIYDRHDLVRQDVKQVICSVCDTEQPVIPITIVWIALTCLMNFDDHWSLAYHHFRCFNVFFTGSSSLFELWCQHGRIFLQHLHILWWWCKELWVFTCLNEIFSFSVSDYVYCSYLSCFRLKNNSFIAMTVEFAELVGVRISSIARSVVNGKNNKVFLCSVSD